MTWLMAEKSPKIAGTASPFGSGNLKNLSLPPAARPFHVGILE